MPYRFLTGPCEVMFAAFVAMLSSLGAIDDLTSPAIWDKTQFRAFCIAGALGGAFLSIALFPPRGTDSHQSRNQALRFGSSAISGLLFTPVVIRWQGWPVDVDVVLAVSGGVALVSVSVISAVVPFLIRKITGKVKDAASS